MSPAPYIISASRGIAAREVEGTMFRGMSYGYLWWIIHPETGVFAAIGDSGNVIYVNPEANAVVAVTAFFKPAVLDRIDFIENVILKLWPLSARA